MVISSAAAVEVVVLKEFALVIEIQNMNISIGKKEHYGKD